MKFADYDQDGDATEFPLQVGAMAGARKVGLLVGISKAIPKLHAFGTAEHPNRPIVLQLWEWDALLKSPKHSVTLTATTTAVSLSRNSQF